MGNRTLMTFRHDPPVESDEQLTNRARGGDQSAFGELYRRHRKAAESTARYLLRSKFDADDVVSDAFTGVLSALRNGHGPRDNFRRYLLACVRNGCRIRRSPHVGMSEDRLERLSPVLEDPERYVEADTVARAFSSLAARWQHTLWLTEVEQRPLSEVSARLRLTPNATAALTHRARQAFATAYLAEHVAAVTDKECAQWAPQLAGYVRNHLADPRLASLERHLVNCAHCSSAVADLRDVNASLRSLVPVFPEALAGATLVVESSLAGPSVVGTSVVGTSVVGTSMVGGAWGTGVVLKGLVAVLLVAPALSADSSPAAGPSTVSEQALVTGPGRGSAPSVLLPVAIESMVSSLSTGVVIEVDNVDAETVGDDDHDEPVDQWEPDDDGAISRPLNGFVDTAFDAGVRPLEVAVIEPLIETLDEALALMGLGVTGETVSVLRTLVPLIDGPLVGVVVDRLLDVALLAPHVANVAAVSSETVAAVPASTAVASAGGPPEATPPLAAPPTVPALSAAIELPAATPPSVSIPPVHLPTIPVPTVAPLLGLPEISLPPISVPVLDLPAISLPDLTG